MKIINILGRYILLSLIVLSGCKKFEEEKFDFASTSLPPYLELKSKTAKTVTEGGNLSLTVQVRTALAEEVTVAYEITGGFTMSGTMKLPANAVEATASVLIPTGTVVSPAVTVSGVLTIKSATAASGLKLSVGRLSTSSEKFDVKVNALTANVSVTHASPDAPGVDLLIDNTKVNTSALTYPSSTGYLKVVAGARNIKVNAAGTTTTVINADIPFVKDKNYSVYAVNLLSSINALLVEDDLTAPESGKAHIRFFHFSPDAPAVTVGYIDGTDFIPIFSDRTFENQTSATANQAFAPVDAGTYDVEVRLAGTTTVVLSLPGIELDPGKIYTVFAKGLVSGTGDQALGAEIQVNK
jgi:hypothetical protein